MSRRILHAVVGHKLPVYFSNAIRSVRRMAPDDSLLIVDNNSELPELLEELRAFAERYDYVDLILRGSNDLTNTKVGGLYEAYAEVVDYALHRDFQYLHIIQSDMQIVWWDESVLESAIQIFEQVPECVNITTTALLRGLGNGGDLVTHKSGFLQLNDYGLTDTGLYDLDRWRSHEFRFHNYEQSHARHFWDRGHRVMYHPMPPVCQIPWPAVVREGVARGHEVRPVHEFLLRPLSPFDVDVLRSRAEPVWLEDVCVPWGWASLLPPWPTALESIDYWVHLWRSLKTEGWRARPRWDRRGLDVYARSPQRRPILWHVLVLPVARVARTRLTRVRSLRARRLGRDR